MLSPLFLLALLITFAVITTVLTFRPKISTWWVVQCYQCLAGKFAIVASSAYLFIALSNRVDISFKQNLLIIALLVTVHILLLKHNKYRTRVPDQINNKGPIKIQVTTLNLNSNRNGISEVFQLLEKLSSDIYIFQEATTEIASNLDAHIKSRNQRKLYLYRNAGKARLQTLIVTSVEAEPQNDLSSNFDDTEVTQIKIKFHGETLSVFGVHLMPPKLQFRYEKQKQILQALSEQLSKRTNPTIVCGDFNLTCYSPMFRRFLHKTGLYNNSKFLPTSTWPNIPLLSNAGISIDHILTTSNFRLLNFYTISDTGSDHKALTAELALDPHGIL